MGKLVTVNLKMDEDVKKNMEQVCSDLGISMSDAFNMFTKKVIREKRIPFEVSIDPFYSEGNMNYLRDIMHDIKNGKTHFAKHDLIEDC